MHSKKDYIIWTPIKSELHNSGNRPIGYRESEVWWCSIGENVGFEEDGKNARIIAQF
jgi:hypothetical protein